MKTETKKKTKKSNGGNKKGFRITEADKLEAEFFTATAHELINMVATFVAAMLGFEFEYTEDEIQDLNRTGAKALALELKKRDMSLPPSLTYLVCFGRVTCSAMMRSYKASKSADKGKATEEKEPTLEEEEAELRLLEGGAQ